MEESTRQKRVASLLQQDIGEILQRNSNRLFKGAFVTVTHTKVTPDLKIAKVYVSILMEKNKQEVMESLEENAKFVRHELGQRIKNQVRVIPELQFFEDDTQEVASKVDQLFKDLDIPPEDENNDMSDYKEQ